MSQNSSTAVMQRRVEAHDSLDDFPTPPWSVRAMLDKVGVRKGVYSCWEPAANRGYLARGLRETFRSVYCSDVHDYGAGFDVHDFLQPYLPQPIHSIDWIITNPPFRLASQFIDRARKIASRGVAVIVRSAFLEGGERYRELFKATPPTLILQHCERVPMVKGRYDPMASSATAYSWLIWNLAEPTLSSRFDWIPPCRRHFMREGDDA